MSGFPTNSVHAEEIAAKWQMHAKAGDIRTQSMMLPPTKTDTDTSRPIATQGVKVQSKSKKGYEQDSVSMISEELSKLAPYPPISGSDLKLIPNPSGKEVVDEERRKSAN